MDPTPENAPMTETIPPVEVVTTPSLDVPKDKPRPKRIKVIAPTVVILATSVLVLFVSWKLGKSSVKIPVGTPTSPPLPISQSVPVTDEKTNWKTYTDPKLNASFSYPATWDLRTDYPSKDTWEVTLSDPNYDSGCTGTCSYFGIRFLVMENPNRLSVSEFIDNEYADSAQEVGEVVLEGLTFKKVTGALGISFYALYTQHDDKIYVIAPSGGLEGMLEDENYPRVKKNLAVFDQILLTFKFIEK